MEKIINKSLVALKSRTVWSVVVLFLVSGVDGIRENIPSNLLEPIQVVLTLLTAYFRVNPKA